MLEEIIKVDHQLFQFINTGLSNVFFDWLMPLLRNKYVWIPLYIAIIFFVIRSYKIAGVYCVLALALSVGVSDYVSASVFKPAFDRLRPCRTVELEGKVISRVSCGTGKSFPSTHAADHFAIALFIFTLFRFKWKYVAVGFLIWAFLICFAQVYVGVHFPLDVFAGGLFGALVGFSGASQFKKYTHFQA